MSFKISNPFQKRDALFLALSVFVVSLYVATAGSGFPLDDSWIHQVYGRNLAEAGEWAFVRGIPSAASTSPLYTVLLATGYKVGISYPLWTHFLGVISLTITAILGGRLAERLTTGIPTIGWITGLTIISTWHLIWAAASGMETMLFSMFTLLLIFRIPSEDTKLTIQNGGLFGIISALAAITRPEGIILGGVCGITVILTYRAKSLRWFIGAIIGFAILITPYLLLNLDLTGGLLPNTASAKQAEYAPLLEKPYISRILSMIIPVLVGGQILLLPGVIYFSYQSLLKRDVLNYFRLLPLLWIIALVALYAARLPAAYQHGRYAIPVLPAFVLIGVIGTYQLVQRGKRTATGRIFTRSLVISMSIAFVYFGFGLGPQVYGKDVQIINEEMVIPAKWIADNLPPEELLAVHDIGAVGYFAPRPILDLAGLVTEEVIPIIRDGDALWGFLEAKNIKYLMAFADQIPGQNLGDYRLCPLFQSSGTTALDAGGTKMIVYRIAWGGCNS